MTSLTKIKHPWVFTRPAVILLSSETGEIHIFNWVVYSHWSVIHTVYIHTYIMCIYRDLYTYSQDYWQGNAENYLWLAELLLSAKGSSHMLRWGCKLSWKWVSFAVSFPFSFVLYLTESACCFTLQTSTNEVVKLWWPSIYMTSFGQGCVSVLGEGRFSALNYRLKSSNALPGRRIAQWGWLRFHLTRD